MSVKGVLPRAAARRNTGDLGRGPRRAVLDIAGHQRRETVLVDRPGEGAAVGGQGRPVDVVLGGVDPVHGARVVQQPHAGEVALAGRAQVDALWPPRGRQVLREAFARRTQPDLPGAEVDGVQVMLGVLVQPDDQELAGVPAERHREIAVRGNPVAGGQHRPLRARRQVPDHDVEAVDGPPVGRERQPAAIRAARTARRRVRRADLGARPWLCGDRLGEAGGRVDDGELVVLASVRVGQRDEPGAVREPHATLHGPGDRDQPRRGPVQRHDPRLRPARAVSRHEHQRLVRAEVERPDPARRHSAPPSASSTPAAPLMPRRNRATAMFSFGAWLRSSGLASGMP